MSQAAYRWLYEQDSGEVRDFFDDLLDSDNDADRVKAVYYFSRKLSRRSLVSLLKAQFQRRTYYYNVVTWLDRLLCSPAVMQKFFSAQLGIEATGSG